MTLEAMTARFAPVPLEADVSGLPPHERSALGKLVEAATVVDDIYRQQVWAGNESLRRVLAADVSEVGRARLRYFNINKGPWSRLDHDEPFVPGVPSKPPQANFYPVDASREEVERWIQGLPADESTRATGFFTTIRRTSDGQLSAVPYSVEYRTELGRLATLLREASTMTRQPTLKRFLSSRAEALLTDDYYESDVAWMELDSSIEPVIGPYEVYEDGWFNYKAAFEAFITIRDDGETEKLAQLGSLLQEIEDNLPIAPHFRNPAVGAMAPIRVVNTIFSTGDANKGVQTAAFNLPNDERVLAAKGSKSVMLKNNQEAKFRTVLQPISALVLSAVDREHVRFDAFFTHILMHELMHGLGPHSLARDGRQTTVRKELKDTYSVIEEVKADVSGLFALRFLVERGVLDRSLDETMYTTYLASMFRSIRFGVKEAHGCGVAIQLNYFLDHGGVRVASDGRFTVDAKVIGQNVLGLTHDVMTIEATGDYRAALHLIATHGVIRPDVQAVLARLQGIPVDIEPRFPVAEALLAEVRC